MPRSPGPASAPYTSAPAATRPAVLVPACNNFVERPWGGLRLRNYKRHCVPQAPQSEQGGRLGEAFEISAWDADPEARAHPSMIDPGDGVPVTLSGVLDAEAERLLGAEFTGRYGRAYPLLPKTLDILELLSVQGHPAGHTEAYIIIDAEPGATLRLGFAADQDPSALSAALHEGRRAQQRLLECFAPAVEAARLHAILAPWFADRAAVPDALEESLAAWLAPSVPWQRIPPQVDVLKDLYWRVLDGLNVIPVAPGQIIYNANPPRVVAATGRAAAAEVHALGNPDGREILMLEIRRPGPTLRAWDNLRLPMRELDIDAALDALNLTRTAPEEFIVEARPDGRRAGVAHSVDCEYFRIEHLRPRPGSGIEIASTWPHTLHVVRGRALLEPELPGSGSVELVQGQSALVGIELARYRLTSELDDTQVVRVELPRGA